MATSQWTVRAGHGAPRALGRAGARGRSPASVGLALALAALLCGCPDVNDGGVGADGGSDGGAVTAEVATYDAYISAYAKADCDWEIRCKSSTRHKTVDACVAAISAQITLQRQRIAASVAAGHTIYSATAATTCLAKVRGDCSAKLQDVLQACNPVIEGGVAIDGDCLGHFECADPPGHTGTGPYCFADCMGLFGYEEPAGKGKCVLKSPVNDPVCKK